MFSLPDCFTRDDDLMAFIRQIGPCRLHEGSSSGEATSPENGPKNSPESGRGNGQKQAPEPAQPSETQMSESQTRDPYASLLRAVTGQQLHNAAARNIFGRLCQLGPAQDRDGPPPAPEALLALDDATLRGCGLSAAKLASLRAIARGRLDGLVPSLAEAKKLDDALLIDRLTQLRGVGRWTVEMLLIFHLHRPDVLPTGDLGVQEGWKRLKKLPRRPTPKELREATLPFSPHRSCLSWYCWQAKAMLPDPAPISKKP